MFQEKIENEYIMYQTGTSEGTQVKYFKDDYWYKKDNRGREGLAEYLVSRLLTFSSLDSSEYVLYEQGTINGISGCRSKNFLVNGENLVTFYRLYYNEFGKDLSVVLSEINQMEERIEYVLRFIEESCGVNVRDYLGKTFMLDMITLNEDRHLNNLALLFAENHFVPAPIFDNGISLLTANQSVNWKFSIEENVRRVIARPFSGSHEKMFRYFGKSFDLDGMRALEWLLTEPKSRERDVLIHQIKRYMAEGVI